MIAVIQRVNQGQVIINKKIYSSINHGYVILLGIFEDDNEKDADKLVKKIINLRIMADDNGKMNKSIVQTDGEILVISQFTLCAEIKGQRRPSFIKAMSPQNARKLYDLFVQKMRQNNIIVKTGRFQNYMEVRIANDGPVTIIADSRKI